MRPTLRQGSHIRESISCGSKKKIREDRVYLFQSVLAPITFEMLSNLKDPFSATLWSWFPLAIFGLLLARMTARHVRRETKIREYGGHAPRFGGWLPLGTTPFCGLEIKSRAAAADDQHRLVLSCSIPVQCVR